VNTQDITRRHQRAKPMIRISTRCPLGVNPAASLKPSKQTKQLAASPASQKTRPGAPVNFLKIKD
jgi:hypothetical protein